MSENKQPSRGFAGTGYYIALIVCAAAIGITGYWYYRSANKPEEVSIQETQDIPVGTAVGTQDVPVLATQPPTKKPLQTTSPVSGQAISGYSMEALSYNQTTRDWRVHNGIDLAAEDGAPVCAAADGEVYTVYEDEALGSTVVIRHQDGYTTCYASLAKDIPVKPGDQVAMGDVIGHAGTTALVESTLGSHVHFSVTCQDEPMDPAAFLSLGKS